MFNKLLKYDFNHYLKLWLIGAGTAMVMSVAGGFCSKRVGWLFEHDYGLIGMMFGLIIFVSVLCIAALGILTKLLVCMRYARNCYSDEGYLTFTLPVRRSAVFNSKLLTGVIYDVMSIVVVIVCAMIFGSFASDNFLTMFFYRLHQIYVAISDEFGVYTVPFIIELVVLIVLSLFLFLNLVFFCVTFAGIKVKKNRILAGIGVGYLTHVILGFIGQILVIAAISILAARHVRAETAPLTMIVMILIAITWLVGANAAFYYSQLNMVENKLNLA